MLVQIQLAQTKLSEQRQVSLNWGTLNPTSYTPKQEIRHCNTDPKASFPCKQINTLTVTSSMLVLYSLLRPVLVVISIGLSVHGVITHAGRVVF